MITINYTTSDNLEKFLDLEYLPQTIYLRIDPTIPQICNVKLMDDFSGKVTGLYDYPVLNLTETNTLIVFILSYKYYLIDKSEELETAYQEIISFNDVVVTKEYPSEDYEFSIKKIKVT